VRWCDGRVRRLQVSNGQPLLPPRWVLVRHGNVSGIGNCHQAVTSLLLSIVGP
jgi:hypothetical protein